MSMKVFSKLLSSLRRARAEGFQFVPLRMISEIKVYHRRKARLVTGGHVVQSTQNEVHATITNSVSTRILMTIAAANNLYVMTGNVRNACLNANTQENVYTHICIEFELVGIMAEGTLQEFIAP